MDPRELKRILDALKDTDVLEFSLETSDFKLAVKRGDENSVTPSTITENIIREPVLVEKQPTVQVETSEPVIIQKQVEPKANAKTIKAPIVGTFYRSPSPDSPVFVEVGDRVEVGKVLCIIEAMKLMNEIESEFSGIVKEIKIQNAEPVEYGQVLFVIE